MMKSTGALAMTAIAAALLTSCGRLPDDRVCSMVIPVPTGLSDAPGKGAVALNCVQKWAYRLARSPDPADKVAQAVIGACWETISPWASARREDARSASGYELTISTRTGQEVTIGEDTFDELHARALFHVVQARAGHCALP